MSNIQQTQAAQPFSLEKIRETVIISMTAMIEKKMIVAPQNYKEEIFFAFQKLAELKDIEKCEVKNICNEMAKIFRNDLAVTKNHCALMVINSKNSPTGKALSMRWQYQGLIHVAKTKCGVKRVTPVLVFENDTFSALYDEGILKIEHIPNFSNGGKMIGGYCVVENGITECRYYTREELDKRRGKSQRQKVWENGVPKGETESNFWLDCVKCMKKRLLMPH
jgi:recombinational DNA repair protein RecT